MASAYGFELKSAQGVIFALNINAKHDRIQTFGDWEAELRKDLPFVCARTEKPNTGKPMMDMITEAHGAAEQLLDIVAVEERAALLWGYARVRAFPNSPARATTLSMSSAQ